MNIKIKTIDVLAITCFTYILVACQPTSASPTRLTKQPLELSDTIIKIERSYVLLSRQELINQADEIFLGQIRHISPTRWNQDSGKYWEETIEEKDGREQTVLPLAYYEIEFSIIHSILGKPDGSLVVTVTGKSPVEDKLWVTYEGRQFEVQFSENLRLQTGDRLIVFAHYNTIPWRNPNKPLQRIDLPDGGYYYDPGDSHSVLCFLQEPASSLFYEGSDGLYHSLENASQKWEPFSLQDLERLVLTSRKM